MPENTTKTEVPTVRKLQVIRLNLNRIFIAIVTVRGKQVLSDLTLGNFNQEDARMLCATVAKVADGYDVLGECTFTAIH